MAVVFALDEMLGSFPDAVVAKLVELSIVEPGHEYPFAYDWAHSSIIAKRLSEYMLQNSTIKRGDIVVNTRSPDMKQLRRVTHEHTLIWDGTKLIPLANNIDEYGIVPSQFTVPFDFSPDHWKNVGIRSSKVHIKRSSILNTKLNYIGRSNRDPARGYQDCSFFAGCCNGVAMCIMVEGKMTEQQARDCMHTDNFTATCDEDEYADDYVHPKGENAWMLQDCSMWVYFSKKPVPPENPTKYRKSSDNRVKALLAPIVVNEPSVGADSDDEPEVYW